MGYHLAGFEVVGVDNKPQRHYPFEFYQDDAFQFARRHAHEFDAIHASPPCQRYCRLRKLTIHQGRSKSYPDLISAVRDLLKEAERPYVIENVEGAPLITPILLCGSMFGLDVKRHRLFECSFGILGVTCNHRVWKSERPPLHRLQGKSRVVGCYGNGRGKGDTVALWQSAMGIDWMIRRELAQAIPPAYTKYIGKQLISTLW